MLLLFRNLKIIKIKLLNYLMLKIISKTINTHTHTHAHKISYNLRISRVQVEQVKLNQKTL